MEKKLTKYQILAERAQKCRTCSINAQSEWAKKFWMSVANTLQERADNLPVNIANLER